MLEFLVRMLEKLEQSRDAADGQSTRRIRVHTATGKVTVKVRLPAYNT